MVKSNKLLFMLMVFVCFVVLFSVSVLAILCMSHPFRGTCKFVGNDGAINCSVGTTIVAYRISGSSHEGNGTYTTVYSGAYGNYHSSGQPNLFVSGTDADQGQIINFIINGINADQEYTDGFTCGATPTTFDLTITDLVLPSIVSVIKANNSYLNSTDKLNVTVSDNKGINSLAYDNGNGINTSFTNNTLFSPGFTTDGNKYIYFYVTDTFGNVYTGTYNYSYDTTAPTLVGISRANNSYLNTTDKITITMGDVTPISNSSYKIGNGNWVGFSNNTLFTPGFSTEANNYLYIRINDSAGNIKLSTYNFSYDNTAPHFIDIGPSANQNTTSLSLHVILWATMNEYSICAYGTSNSNFGSLNLMNTTNNLNFTANLTFTADATPTYYVKCNDSAGNINTVGNSTSFSIDVTPDDDNTPVNPSTGPGGDSDGPSSTPSSTPITTAEDEEIGGKGKVSEATSGAETMEETALGNTIGATNGTVEAAKETDDKETTSLILKIKSKIYFILLALLIILLIVVLVVIIKKTKKKQGLRGLRLSEGEKEKIITEEKGETTEEEKTSEGMENN